MTTPTPTTVQVKIQLRRDTAATWASVNPVLLAGEAGLETDTNKIKIGNGSTAWNSLGYFPFVVNGGTVTGNLEIGTTGTLTFEGSSADNFETTLGVVNPTADRTINLPNVSGTIITTGDSGTVTSTMIADGTIVDADVSATAEIAVSKLADGTARQLLQTDAAGTGVEWASNIDIPGTLDVTGAATFDAAVSVALGSAASPSLTFTGDTNTGIYSPGADQVAVATNGTARLYIASDGKVGIGTTPGQILDIQASGTAIARIKGGSGSGQGASFFVTQAGSASTLAAFGDRATAFGGTVDQAVSIYTNTNIPLTFDVGSNEKARIDASGTFRVKGAGTAGVNDAFAVNGSAPANSAQIDSSGRLLVGTSTARANYYNSTGSAQIQVEGTAFSDSSISITSNNNAGSYVINRSNGASIGSNTLVANGNTVGGIVWQGNDGTQFVQCAGITAAIDGTPGADDMPGRLVFSTTADGASSPTERCRIASNGVYTIYSSTSALFVGSAGAAGTSEVLINGYYGATGTTALGSLSFRVYTNGDVQNTNNSYAAISDIKLKENIVDASSQWEDIKALQVRNYNLKEGQTHKQIGLIAQEVELVSPGLVNESTDHDAEGNDLGTVTKSVNYSVLYMKAVKALQEAMERIEQLETEMAEVKAQLS